MESYNTTKIKIAGWITTVSIAAALLAELLVHNESVMDIAFILTGLTAIVFSHDLAMRDFVKHKANYKMFRIGYLVVGIVFVAVSVAALINHN